MMIEEMKTSSYYLLQEGKITIGEVENGEAKKKESPVTLSYSIWGEGVSGNCFHTALRRIESRHHFLDRFEAITLAPSNEPFFPL